MNDKIFTWVDKIFSKVDKIQVKRTKNITRIPGYKNRRGGKLSYAEWAHVIGIFQTLIYQVLENKAGNKILDIGCGTGLLGMSAEPFITGGGTYTGIDVMVADIEFCKSNFTAGNFSFVHLDVANPTYAGTQSKELKLWPIEDESQDLLTALSVWTHLKEEDAIFYFKEITRVLKKGGKAIITFFILDEEYRQSLGIRKNENGRFHATNQKEWIFDVHAYKSENWFTTAFAKNPEDVIGITNNGLNMLLESAGLRIKNFYAGNWKEIPGIYFQDVLILEK